MTARRSRENVRNARGMYVDGNTVRRLQEVPERNIPAVRGTQDRRQRKTTNASSAKTARRAHAVSRETMRNRQKAMSMGRGFVFFSDSDLCGSSVLLCELSAAQSGYRRSVQRDYASLCKGQRRTSDARII